MKMLKYLLMISVFISTNAFANDLIPNDIPHNIVKYYESKGGAFLLRENDSLVLPFMEEAEKKAFFENLIRAEILAFIIRDKNVTAGTLFNSLGLFKTYSKLVDTTPQSLWRNMSLQPMNKNYVLMQIRIAHSYYQNQLIEIGYKIEIKHLPPVKISNDNQVALQK